MKVFLSSDIEGTAGIVDWTQVLAGRGGDFALGQRLLLNEVNAAIEGAVAGGATEVVVNDSHYLMQNLPPDQLAARARYLSGKHKPLYMMEGLDSSFGAALFVSYHGSIGHPQAILSHTYNPGAVYEVRLNGDIVGESALNALVAQHHGVPVVLITGDQATADEALTFAPDIEAVVVKRSVSRFAAESLHPAEACEVIRAGAERAVSRAAQIGPPQIRLPARLEVDFLVADMADMATWITGFERTGHRSAALESDDPLGIFRAFVTMIALTRSIVDA
ncbi:MAG: M55 family metallopeptidase [Gaiellales bacterium]